MKSQEGKSVNRAILSPEIIETPPVSSEEFLPRFTKGVRIRVENDMLDDKGKEGRLDEDIKLGAPIQLHSGKWPYDSEEPVVSIERISPLEWRRRRDAVLKEGAEGYLIKTETKRLWVTRFET